MPEEKEDVMEMTYAAVFMNLSKKTKRAIKVLSEAMNSAYFIHDVHFCNPEELHEADAKEVLVVSVDFSSATLLIMRGVRASSKTQVKTFPSEMTWTTLATWLNR